MSAHLNAIHGYSRPAANAAEVIGRAKLMLASNDQWYRGCGDGLDVFGDKLRTDKHVLDSRDVASLTVGAALFRAARCDKAMAEALVYVEIAFEVSDVTAIDRLPIDYDTLYYGLSKAHGRALIALQTQDMVAA